MYNVKTKLTHYDVCIWWILYSYFGATDNEVRNKYTAIITKQPATVPATTPGLCRKSINKNTIIAKMIVANTGKIGVVSQMKCFTRWTETNTKLIFVILH